MFEGFGLLNQPAKQEPKFQLIGSQIQQYKKSTELSSNVLKNGIIFVSVYKTVLFVCNNQKVGINACIENLMPAVQGLVHSYPVFYTIVKCPLFTMIQTRMVADGPASIRVNLCLLYVQGVLFQHGQPIHYFFHFTFNIILNFSNRFWCKCTSQSQ